MASDEVRSDVPAQLPSWRWPAGGAANPRTNAIVAAAVRVVHVYANTGPWDGGVQLGEAIKDLAFHLEPMMVFPENTKAPPAERPSGAEGFGVAPYWYRSGRHG